MMGPSSPARACRRRRAGRIPPPPRRPRMTAHRSQQANRARAALYALLLAGAAGLPAHAAALFKINLIPGPGLLANPDALAAFGRAAGEWEASISSPIVVNVTADLGTFADPNIIGATDFGSEPLNLDYTTVRARMVARANRAGNAILASLPESDKLHAIV